jgi:hypothetical protein
LQRTKPLRYTATISWDERMGNELSGPTLAEQLGCCTPKKVVMTIPDQKKFGMQMRPAEKAIGGVGIVFVKDVKGGLYVNLLVKVIFTIPFK